MSAERQPAPQAAAGGEGARYELLLGDALTVMRGLPANSVQCAVTSPPYFGLRDYGTATWEGGDAECDHVAGKAQYDRKATDRPTAGPTRGGAQPHDRWDVQYRDTCGKCGARRVDQQIGLEDTPSDYVARLVDVFREVRRLLHPTGVLWLNLGDSYANSTAAGDKVFGNPEFNVNRPSRAATKTAAKTIPPGLKPKDLIGIPWMVAFALRADGWYLRSEIIWHKKAPMPESVTDRPTKAHEQVFLLAKSRDYYYDHIAIMEPNSSPEQLAHNLRYAKASAAYDERAATTGVPGGINHVGIHARTGGVGRNKRSVWTLGPESYSGAHFATMPTKLVEPCILAGTSAYGCCAKCGAPWARLVEREAERYNAREGIAQRLRNQGATNGGTEKVTLGVTEHVKRTTTGWAATCTCNADVVPCTVLDPFNGSGTTGAVALKHHRRYIGIDLNESYIALAHRRIQQSQPLLFALEVQA